MSTLPPFINEIELSVIANKLKSKYLTFEGLDGSGKTTTQKWLASLLATLTNVKEVREPGSTSFGEDIRSILLNAPYNLDSLSELMLFMASRNELLHQVIIKSLENEEIVLSDRCYISSYAYQAFHNNFPLRLFQDLVAEIYHKQKINIIIYHKIDYQEGLKRSKQVQDHDNIESKGRDFYADTQRGYEEYLELLKKDKKSLVIKGFSQEEVELFYNLDSDEALIIVNAQQSITKMKESVVKALFTLCSHYR